MSRRKPADQPRKRTIMNINPITGVTRVIPPSLVINQPGAYPHANLNPMSFMDILKQSGDYYNSYRPNVKNSSPNWGMLLDIKM